MQAGGVEYWVDCMVGLGIRGRVLTGLHGWAAAGHGRGCWQDCVVGVYRVILIIVCLCLLQWVFLVMWILTVHHKSRSKKTQYQIING